MGIGAPVLLLGGPGSGIDDLAEVIEAATDLSSGDVAGVVADGLGLGAPVVASVHRHLLAGADRDWTCPPARLVVDEIDVGPLHAWIGQAGSSSRLLVADARTLFCLRAWVGWSAGVVPIGVVADHRAVVERLGSAGLPAAVAADLAAAHTRRLRVLQERLDFPVLDLDATATVLRDRLVSVLQAEGVAVDQVALDAALAAGRLGPDRADLAAWPDDDGAVLRARAAASSAGHGPRSGAQLTAALEVAEADSEDVDLALDTHVGPRAAQRRQAAWLAVPRSLDPVVEVCRHPVVAADGAVAREGAVVVAARDLSGLLAGLRTASEQLTRPPAAILLPDVLSWAGVDDLGGVLTTVVAHLDVAGLVVVGHSPVDLEAIGAGDSTFEALDALEAAAASAGLATVDRHHGGEVDLARFVRPLPTDDRVQEALGRLGADTTVVAVGQLPDLARAAASVGDPRHVPETPSGPGWQRAYERLSGRRTVRAALAAADLARPVVQATRRLRRGWTRG